MKKTELVKRVLAFSAAVIIAFTSTPIIPVVASESEAEAIEVQQVNEEVGVDESLISAAYHGDDDDNGPVTYGLQVAFDETLGNIAVEKLLSDAAEAVTGADADGGKTYTMEAGSKYVVTIVPNAGYEIASINVNGVEQIVSTPQQQTYTIEAADQQMEISVTFCVTAHNIQVAMNAAHGTVTVTDLESQQAVVATSADGNTANYAGNKFGAYEIKISLNEGYEIESMPEGYVKAEDAEVYTYTIQSLESDYQYVVCTKQIINNIAVNVSNHGKVFYDLNGASQKLFTSANSGDSAGIPYNNNATFTFVPDSAYYVSSVMVNGSAVTMENAQVALLDDGSAAYTFTGVVNPQSIEVQFEAISSQRLAMGEDENIDDMLARGHIAFSFQREGDRSKVCAGEDGYTYTLTHGNNMSVNTVSEDGRAYQILDNNQLFVNGFTVEKTQKLEQYTVRRTSGDWNGSVVRYRMDDGIRFVVDNSAPQVSIDGDAAIWLGPDNAEEPIVLTGTVADETSGSGIKAVVWYTQKKDIVADEATIVAEATNVATVDGNHFEIAIGDAPETNTTYYVYALDEAYNITEDTVEYRWDKVAPTVTVKTENKTTWWDWPWYWNKDKIEITVTADDANGSGVNSATLFINGEEIETKKCNADGTCVFVKRLSSGIEYTYTAIATDNVGNKTEGPVDGGTVYYDNTKPTIGLVVGEGAYEAEGVIYCNDNIGMTIQVADSESGLKNVVLEINGQQIATDTNGKAFGTDYTSVETQTFTDEFVISTALGVADAQGCYRIKITVTDVAGNPEEEKYTVYKDNTAPEITGFAVTGKNASNEAIIPEGSGAVSTESFVNYGYYAANSLTVDVSATDGEIGSGIAELSYIVKNADGSVNKTETVAMGEDGKCQITIPADFKGSVYVKAKDNVGNEMAEYVTTDAMIAESQARFDTESHIVMAAPAANAKDADGNNLYAGDVAIPIVITDAYAGIRTIEWSVNAPQDDAANQRGTVSVDNSGNISQGMWTVKAMENNLATRVEGAIPVSSNSNAIVVTVTMTNRAGYVSTESFRLSIDKTSPIVEIKYDIEQGDAAHTDYFSQTRTATISVQERNFDEAKVNLNITNTDGAVPTISAWSSTGVGTDDAVHTAQLVFEADGDYTVSMDFADAAGNKATTFAEQKFTIDKTMPEIQVTFDNEQGRNGNYFATERTATITVNEHNFDSDRVEIVGVATDNGNTITFPVTSLWSDSGDSHTATILFDRDGQYSFTVSGLDMAGNEAEMVEVEEYYIDLTEPVIEIYGVEDMSANNGTVQPIVQIIDTNYSQSDVEIQLVGANRGNVAPEGAFTDSENGQTFHFSDFANEQAVDDIYTLTATETDMAGNTVTETITFSVNRFGSVYTLNGGLEEITGTYIKEAVDIVLTETNVDVLDENSIEVVLSANGTPRTLEKGVDYTLSRFGGNGSWNQYEYNLHKENFEGDGTYKVTIYSVDAAGNVNETVDETKKAEIEFGVDGTAPVIVPLNIEEGGNYDVEQLAANFSVQDNLVLEDVKVTLNGEVVECQVNGDTYEFVIPEDSTRQSVVVLAQDAAGNALTYEVTDLLVSTNGFVRWYNNKPLFAGTLVCTGVATGGIGAAFGLRNKNFIRIKRK